MRTCNDEGIIQLGYFICKLLLLLLEGINPRGNSHIKRKEILKRTPERVCFVGVAKKIFHP